MFDGLRTYFSSNRTPLKIDCEELIGFMRKNDFPSVLQAAIRLNRDSGVINYSLVPIKTQVGSPFCGRSVSDEYIDGRLLALDKLEPITAITWARRHGRDHDKRCRALLADLREQKSYRGVTRILHRRTGSSYSTKSIREAFFGAQRVGKWKRGPCKKYAEQAWEALTHGGIVRGSLMPKWPEEDYRLHRIEKMKVL
jgi:hypothetical protein